MKQFLLPEEDGYFRLIVTDSHGRHACTNAYFVDEVLV